MNQNKNIDDMLRDRAKSIRSSPASEITESNDGVLTELSAKITISALGRAISGIFGTSATPDSDYRIESLNEGIGIGTQVYRVHGAANHQGILRPWSVILKTLHRSDGQEHGPSVFYWKRELDFSLSEMANRTTPGLRPPKLYHYQQVSEDEIFLWFEDIPNDGHNWSDHMVLKATERVGLYNAFWAMEPVVPTFPWMNAQKGIIKPWWPLFSERVEKITSNEKDTKHFFPDEINFAGHIASAWERTPTYASFMSTLPETWCHFDAHKQNLIWNNSMNDDLVAIDWSYTGPGILGQELAAMIYHPVAMWHQVAPTDIEGYAEGLFGSYVSGLRSGGWKGDLGDVRAGYLGYLLTGLLGIVITNTLKIFDGEDQTNPDNLAQDMVAGVWRYHNKCEKELEQLIAKL